MFTSRGVSPTQLDRAADHFAQRDRRGRPASKMMRFAAPLLEAVGEDHEGMNRALTLAMAFWNLALCKREQYDELLAHLTGTVAQDEREASAFHAIAADMVERHRQMFPELHALPVGR
jgi:3-oxoacyl-(acyl-carrier-protein) synthase